MIEGNGRFLNVWPQFYEGTVEETAVAILKEFGLDPETGHIINGHLPVQVKKGERPIKANGKLLVIDGGFAKAYQPITGIAGYSLIFNSFGLLLASQAPFESKGGGGSGRDANQNGNPGTQSGSHSCQGY